MAFDVPSASGPRHQMNITPLIDVVLVLLIIFMVGVPTALKHLTPTVARDAPATAAPPAAPVLVELTAAGAVKVNGEETGWDRLPAVVRARLLGSHQQAVFFRISDDADYGQAVHLFDLCRGAGAQVLALPSG